MEGLIGKTVGRYQITEHLGRGGMAEVYKAFQPSLDRYVAIKIMHAFLADDKDFRTRFEREAKFIATLRHPNIVQVYDFVVENGQYYMVMEFIDGVTLKSMLEMMHERGGWVTLDDAVTIVVSLGSALRYAHERGMLHRDVKPANVMITSDGHVILTDFGIAKILSATNLTASGAMVGTPSYMSPEQGMGQAGDERSDIYSLGVMLYQLAVGRLPYDADTPLAVVLKHINEPLPVPRALKSDLPEGVERVIVKALAKNPDDRYQTVAEMTAELKRAMGLPADVTPTEQMKDGSAMKLAGATVVGRIGAVTPQPERAASSATVARTGASSTAARPAAPATAVPPHAVPEVAPQPVVQPAAAGRPKWLIPVIALVVLALVAGGIAVVASGTQAPPPPPPTAAPSPTLAPSPTEVGPPEGQFTSESVELRDEPGAEARIKGVVGPAFGPFTVQARTVDSEWLRIEFPDGTDGWVPANAVDMGGVPVDALPIGRPPATLTPAPTATPAPSDTPRPTSTPTPSHTPAPTRPPATRPPATATPPPLETPTQAALVPLGWGFTHDFCTYDGDNYTCNVTIWGTGGDGKYHFAVENPDTGIWEEKTGGQATYLVRSRRCRVRVQQVRIWDESGNHIEPNLTTDPDVLGHLFPGGACTQP
ncbi:MAG TPA: protein kinase [Anaerolineae bacterium]|nr:protein kinase [Anaerolineae bacterium]